MKYDAIKIYYWTVTAYQELLLQMGYRGEEDILNVSWMRDYRELDGIKEENRITVMYKTL